MWAGESKGSNGQCWATGGEEGKALGAESAWKTLALKRTWERAKETVPGGAGGTHVYLQGRVEQGADRALGKWLK